MNFIKSFRGVPNGAIYPITYLEGDECPSELEQAAIEQGAIIVDADDKPADGPVIVKPPRNKKSGASNDNPS